MHNQEAHLRILDNVTTTLDTSTGNFVTVTISNWNAGTYSFTTSTGDVRFDVTNVNHPLNQNVTLTN